MASGDTLLIFSPLNNVPPASNYATPDVRNQHWVLDFDDTTSESAVFSGVMPQHYAGTTGVTVKITFCATTATSGNVQFDVAFEEVTGLDIDADSFAAANSTDAVATNGTSGIPGVCTATFTDGADMDNVAAGDAFRLKVSLNVTGSTISGDAELWLVEIRET